MRRRTANACRRAHGRVGARRAVPLLMAGALALVWAPLPALALPEGGVVAAGSATVSAPTATSMQITQATDRLVMDWTRFNIAAHEAVRFQQPSAASMALNRVLSHEPSHIFGSLSANGQVILSNPGGILFGPTARVDVGALLATTGTITTQDFLTGTYRFAQHPGAANAAVINQGFITAGAGGYVALLGAAVRNEGVIQAQLGSVALGAARAATLDLRGDGLIGVVLSERVAGAVTGPDGQPMTSFVSNSGAIQADGGLVTLQAAVAAELVRATLNQEGVVRARTVDSRAGRMFLAGGDEGVVSVSGTLDASGQKGDSPPSSTGTVPLLGGTVQVTGDVVLQTGAIQADGSSGGLVAIHARNVLSAGRVSADGVTGAGGAVTVTASGRLLHTSAAHLSADGAGGGGTVTLQAAERVFGSGTLTATGQGAGATGGKITVLGNEIVLLGARINASGDAGGGTVLIGGDFQGKNPAVQNATTNWINFSTTINADSLGAGNGGRVIVWADDQTQVYGAISARGGAQSGDGGFIEVSGKEHLVFGGMADAGAPNGKPGTLLLDPKNIVISSAGGGGGLTSFQLIDPNPGAGNEFAKETVVLPNNNVVATDPNDDFAAVNAGAVYLFNGTTGSLISTLIGSSASDLVGLNGVTVLTNGNYVVRSSGWANGTARDAGAVTFGNGTSGVSGVVSAANSLVGSSASDLVGFNGVTALANGNYVVNSPGWDNGMVRDAGAVTWGNGTSGVSGVVSAANSLVGTQANDRVGRPGVISNFGVTALTNGNYVVSSVFWANGTARDAGAVTWGNGMSGVSGPVSATNSLVGTQAADFVGDHGVTALANGNYVVNSPGWDNGMVRDAGAVTWGNGTSGVSGVVSAANSLVGTQVDDLVGRHGGISNFGVTALTNGNYVVRSPDWDNGTATDAGAVTFGNGTSGVSGPVSATNSLVGSQTGDQVGHDGVTALTNGNYVVRSPDWDNGTATDAGAVTFGNGTSGVSGPVSAANSLVGSQVGDRIGSGGISGMPNGNVIVRSPFADKGAVVDAGLVHVVTPGGGSFTNPLTFATDPSSTVTITPAQITAITNTGQNVVLQANNDITVNAAVNVNNPAGNGGHLTLQAGRSIVLNSSITTDNGNLTLIANEIFPPAASGLVSAQREAGQAVITTAPGATLNVGAGILTRLVRPAMVMTGTGTAALQARVIDAQAGILNLSLRGQPAGTLLSFSLLPPDLIMVRGERLTGRQGRPFWGDLAGPGKVTIKK